MGKKKRMALAALLAMILFVLLWAVLQPPKVKEPVYKDIPLGQWLDSPKVHAFGYMNGGSGGGGTEPDYAEAIRQTGTNAIPWLLQESSAHEIGLISILKQQLRQRTKMHLVTAGEHQDRAKKGLNFLGKAGGLAVTQGLTNSDKWIRFGCVGQWEIGKQYPDIYIPALLTRLKDPDAEVRARAANALGLMDHQQDEKIVPALIEALDDPKDSVRTMAAVGLGCIGKPAKAAAPILLKLMSNSTPDFQFWASNSLKSIGPIATTNQSP